MDVKEATMDAGLYLEIVSLQGKIYGIIDKESFMANNVNCNGEFVMLPCTAITEVFRLLNEIQKVLFKHRKV